MMNFTRQQSRSDISSLGGDKRLNNFCSDVHIKFKKKELLKIFK